MIASSSTIGESSSSLLDLTGQIVREHIYPSAFGGFADVWTGTWKKKSGSCKVFGSPRLSGVLFLKTVFQVAIKVLRSTVESPEARSKIDKVNLA